MGIPPDQPLPTRYWEFINWKTKSPVGLSPCVLCHAGKHKQCEELIMPFCSCFREDHARAKVSTATGTGPGRTTKEEPMATKAPAKKTAAAKKPALKVVPDETQSPSEARRQRDLELGEQVVSLRGEDKKWSEISEALGIGQGKAMFLMMVAEVADEDRITYTTDKQLADKVVRARDKDLNSWGRIAARTGISEGKIKKIYTEATGKSLADSEIGKGGRRSNGSTPAKAAAPVKKAVAKAAGPKTVKGEAELNPARKHLADMDIAELSNRLNGQTITVKRGGKLEKIVVTEVVDLEGGVMVFNNADEEADSVPVDSITKATRK